MDVDETMSLPVVSQAEGVESKLCDLCKMGLEYLALLDLTLPHYCRISRTDGEAGDPIALQQLHRTCSAFPNGTNSENVPK